LFSHIASDNLRNCSKRQYLFKVCHLQDAFPEDLLPSFALGAPTHATVDAYCLITNHQSQPTNKHTCGEQSDLPQGEPLCIVFNRNVIVHQVFHHNNVLAKQMQEDPSKGHVIFDGIKVKIG
jgi:hypothetical protein